MPRIFLASPVVPTHAMREVMAGLRVFDRALRVVRTDPLHLTWRFLGEVDEACVPQIPEVLRAALAEAKGGPVPWFGPDAWPHPAAGPDALRRTRILAMHPDASAGARVLQPIADAIDRACDGLAGIPPRDRPFVPHVTIARFRRRVPRKAVDEFAAWLRQHRAAALGETDIAAVELIESELRPRGPRHTVRHRVALK